MAESDQWCEHCASRTEGAIACARCGQFRKQPSTAKPAPPLRGRRAIVENVAHGIVVGIIAALAVLGAWGFGNLMVMSAFTGNVPSSCVNFSLGVYASPGVRAYIVILEVVTGLICIAALVQAVRWARSSHPARAIALMLAVFAGLLPATMCDASMIFGHC